MNTINNYVRPIGFSSKTAKASRVSQSVIDHFGLNMNTLVGYKGKPSYTPAPDTLPKDLKSYFDKLEIDWNTRVDIFEKRKRFDSK
ncbi:hypothetical protein J6O48_05310 [bacterium]|nr:hypothetical protein [bacterium]